MWICREWTNDPINGWTSEFSTWETKAEAEDMGMVLVDMKLIVEYEVYEQSGE